MRLIDADKLYPDVLTNKGLAISQSQVANAPTVERPKSEWKVLGRGISTLCWHLVCPKCNCDMLTEFTSYCPNCGEPMEEINIAELNMEGGDKE